MHIALIDAGVDVSHPWLGGGMGPTFPIIGGADLVDGDGTRDRARPTPPSRPTAPRWRASCCAPRRSRASPRPPFPRLLVYRVVAPEAVGGRVRPLARSDRVLAALERAVDPNGDGDPSDTAQVILIGLSAGLDAAGTDPVADAAAEADRVGATVVAPAGNDGPTFSRPGSVGGLAARPTVIAVGGASAPDGPRTADLDARLGPARRTPRPAAPAGPRSRADGAADRRAARRRRRVRRAPTDAQFRTAEGVSLVAGSLVVIARGRRADREVAARAAAAGAGAVALWDEDGGASFPAIPGDSGLALPVVGLGASQGAALVRLAQSAAGARGHPHPAAA